MSSGRDRTAGAVWLALAAVCALFALDLHLDTRERDLFSWMDPYQYYDFARGVLAGSEPIDGFEIPSIFPFFVVPLLAIDASIPTSMAVHCLALLVLVAGLHGLCRELAIRTPSPVVALLVLSSPILLGLSRTLYVEFTLTALATVTFLLWLRVLRRPDRRSLLAFAALLALSFLTKITFPLFMAGPVAGAVIGRVAAGRPRAGLDLALAASLPIALAMAIHVLWFAPSIGYYLTVVSTSRPFMFLMGPPDPWSWESAGYYFGELGRSFLFLLAPLLAIPVGLALRDARSLRWRDLASPHAALWLWLLGPLLLLIAHPLKEPRHAAPCAVPAVLLIVMGIEALPKRGARAALTMLALLLALLQYAAVTTGRLEKPYFLDGPLHYPALRQSMETASGPGASRSTALPLRDLHWSYNQNVALDGFPANEALALTWQGFPGVVFDLETLADPARVDETIPYRSFEDLFFLVGINTYNRRCGWRHYLGTLPHETVVAHADFVLVRGGSADEATRRYPGHAHRATIERASADIHVLQAREPTTPYRTLYARRFLARHPSLPEGERRTVAEEMLVASLLDGDDAGARALSHEFPVLGDPRLQARNIYWIGGYPALLDLARQRIERLSRPRPR